MLLLQLRCCNWESGLLLRRFFTPLSGLMLLLQLR